MIRTRVGYAGGTTPSPTYRNIGDHTEVIQFDFDPTVITYRELLDVFWEHHTPTRSNLNRQYRNVVLVHNEEQREDAEAKLREMALEIEDRITTPIEMIGTFTRAEDYHQKYYLRAAGFIYDELRAFYPEELDFVDATSSSRINAYIGGYGTMALFEQERELLGLSDAALAIIHERVEQTDASCQSAD